MMLAKVEKQDGMTIAKVKTYPYQSASIPTTAACCDKMPHCKAST